MSVFKPTIAVMTSGGDAPGMNAAIQGIYTNAAYHGFHILGIRNGFNGLIHSQIFKLTAKDVKDITRLGGTILGTSRCSEMLSLRGQLTARDVCLEHHIQAVLVIGGDGSFQGAQKLCQLGIGTIGIPATIDMDIGSTEYTLGFDTAVNSAMEAIDKIKETGQAHSCCSVIEVMGRHSGYNALWCSIANTASAVIIPEKKSNEQIIRHLQKIHFSSGTVIIAEGAGKASDIAGLIESQLHIHARADVLGFLQRGGSPTCKDRLMGFTMGAYAVDTAIRGHRRHIIAVKNGQLTAVDIDDALVQNKPFPEYIYHLQSSLAPLF